MKVVIAGGREFDDWTYFAGYMSVLPTWLDITEVVSGGARGADALGEEFAYIHNIKLTVFPADWETHKRAAGPIRNEQMAKYADGVIAFWDGKSSGTKNMISVAAKYKKWVYCVRTDIKWDAVDPYHPNNVFITGEIPSEIISNCIPNDRRNIRPIIEPERDDQGVQ